jgi:hypothetical protein
MGMGNPPWVMGMGVVGVGVYWTRWGGPLQAWQEQVHLCIYSDHHMYST